MTGHMPQGTPFGLREDYEDREPEMMRCRITIYSESGLAVGQCQAPALFTIVRSFSAAEGDPNAIVSVCQCHLADSLHGGINFVTCMTIDD